MNCCQGEPSLSDALSDPIVRAIMAADHVDPQVLASSLRETAAKVAQSGAVWRGIGRTR